MSESERKEEKESREKLGIKVGDRREKNQE